MLIVLSAPSGAGKTTIARRILRMFPDLKFSVSATTRPRRPVEHEGEDYFFLTRSEFEDKINRNDFVEWEEIYGNLYGTPAAEIDAALARCEHMLFDVDVKGALALSLRYPRESELVFIYPPDLETLRRRLLKRHTESEESINRRMERVEWELRQSRHFRHMVVNADLEVSVSAVAGIIRNATLMLPQAV